MKRILVSTLLCTSLLAAAQTQTTHTVKLVDTQLQDVLNVLEDMDIYIHRFDVSQFLDATYNGGLCGRIQEQPEDGESAPLHLGKTSAR